MKDLNSVSIKYLRIYDVKCKHNNDFTTAIFSGGYVKYKGKKILLDGMTCSIKDMTCRMDPKSVKAIEKIRKERYWEDLWISPRTLILIDKDRILSYVKTLNKGVNIK